MAAKFPNATDKQIADREAYYHKNGSPGLSAGVVIPAPFAYVQQQPEIVTAGAAAQKAQAGGTTVHNSGVVMNHDDKPNKFLQPGKKA